MTKQEQRQKWFRGEPKGDGHWEGTYQYFNNLNDIPTDEPLNESNIIVNLPQKCNPFFVNALKILNPSYNVPSREVLSGWLLDNQIAKVNDKVDKIIEFATDITIGLDGWTAPDGSSIWNFIELVIERIGSKKISAIVTDNGANIAAAKRLICSKYKNIMNIRCIAHNYNLISKDIIQHTFAVRMIQRANRIVQFFKKSHKAAAMLKEKIKQHKIGGGGPKTYIETRWVTVHECVSSIVRLKIFEVFVSDMQHLSEILLPIKNAILAVEAAQSTLADAYINLLKIAAAIQNLSTDEYKGFLYKGAGLKFGTFPVIANYAGQLWQRMSETKKGCEQLITQLRHYKDQNCIVNGKPNPYMAPYSIGSDIPLMWWNTCEVKPNHLQRLAIKLFSIIPSSASCERMFSSLGWLYGKRRTQLKVDKLEGRVELELEYFGYGWFRSPIFHPNGTHFNNNDGEEYGDESSENEEDYEYEVDEIIICRLEEMNVN
ncbi:ribonuclease H-like domain-containing protein [Rhizophagus clarus]|uniref:Ribonuclease H-like domain-containing protein n=1 Tax=Rhizophagus clarus TaxID=94130 RepID=A0A8H3R842_9GLOM|nr:ribonuclease H-like domain-containing protein [Rhizophagus clarus]